MPKLLKDYPIIFICLLLAVMLLPNLETIQVTIMEARNFITAREMLLDDHWILTTMNGEARY
ncbi:MAG: glycosyltransferase, partial [Olleya sp.]